MMLSSRLTQDKPGMMEAKVIPTDSPSTSTPFKKSTSSLCLKKPLSILTSLQELSPVVSKSKYANSRHEVGQNVKTDAKIDLSALVDSGFCSFTDSQTTNVPSNDSSSSLSMFRNIMESSNNSSMSLEQVVDKVNSRKENQAPNFWAVNPTPRNYFNRPRSHSASEITLSSKFKRTNGTKVKKSPIPPITPSPNLIRTRSHASESGSPTMEQAILMGCRERAGTGESDRGYGGSINMASTSPDYNLEELVRAMRLKHGDLQPPPTPSPPESYYRRSPISLFGAAALQCPQPKSDTATRRPKLPSISENEKCSLPSCSTPEEYYMSSFFPMSSDSPVYSNPYKSPSMTPSYPNIPASQDTPAQFCHKQTIVQQQHEPVCTWSGQLPPRQHKNPVFSCKIFLGGVPWDVTESSLIQAFSQFGPIRIEWPGKDTSPSPPKGYVYIVFEQEQHVPLLLSQCTHDYANGGSWYFKISSRRMRSKEVQIIPWVLADSNFVRCPSQRLDPQKTVFVGALHGMMNAESLAHIFNDLFGGVVYAGIDTDKHRYPIGSGRVTFNSINAYMKAVAAAFVEVKCQKFSKKVQVDPYLEDALCSCCLLKQGPYFCRDLSCFKYFCRHCWELAHSMESIKHHKPLMRNNRSGGGPATRPTISLTPPPTSVKTGENRDW